MLARGSGRLLISAALAVVAGVAIGGAGLLVPVLVVLAAASLQLLGWTRLTVLLIGSTFVTVVRIDILGATFRLEHLVLLATVFALVVAGHERSLIEAARDRTAMLFAAFVLWSAVASLLQSVSPGESLLIVGWLALDWLFLVVVLATWRNAASLGRTGLRFAGLAALVGIVLWVAAQTVGTTVGVSAEAGGTAAAGLSFEPNLLGATVAFYVFVAFTGRSAALRGKTNWVIIVGVVAVALSLTRAAMVGLGLGLVIWAGLSGWEARLRLLRLLLAGTVAAVIIVLLAPQVAGPVSRSAAEAFDFEAGTGRNRLESWRTAVADLDGINLIVGLGTNSFGQRHLEPTLPATPTPAYLANLPLQIVYDTGLIGAALLAAIVASILSARRLRDGRAAGLLVLYVVCASATSPFWYGTTWVLVAMAILDRRANGPPGEGASQSLLLTRHRVLEWR
jgi:hypothetical protein